MAVDIKKLIAAISPDVFCDDTIDEKTNKPLYKEVKKIVKEDGYLKAAEKAKLRDSDFLDVINTRFTKGAFAKAGLDAPIEQHSLTYDVSSQSLEQIYFWILDYVNDVFGGADKLVDNFISSPGSGHFAEIQGRATRMQEEAMKIFQTTGSVLIKSILNIIYDLKEWQIRLSHYDDLKSEDKEVKKSAMLSLKQIWMDNVDIKRGTGSINGLAQQLEFVTLRDAFMMVDSLKACEDVDLNERVKRILLQRFGEFLKWIKESERESRKRFEIEKIYLKSQVNTVRLYSRWAKPYLKAAAALESRGEGGADIVTLFNTSVSELTLLAKGRYSVEGDVDKGDLPNMFKKLNLRKYTPITTIEFRFRSIPDRADQRGGYAFRGKVDVTFTSFALNDDELKVMKQEVEKDDFGDMYQMIAGATDESLGFIQNDIDELLGIGKDKKKEEEVKKKDKDSNPFSALFSGLSFSFGGKKKKEEEKDLSKGVPEDSDYEEVVRSQAILAARGSCRKLYNDFKKAHGMLAFPPTQF